MPTADVTTAVTVTVGDGPRVETPLTVTVSAVAGKIYASVTTAVYCLISAIGSSGDLAGKRYRR